MAGHSHWKRIKYKKGTADAQRSRAFAKVSRLISVAAKEGGSNPASNPKLRSAIERAKELNMPSENIDRAVKRGIGGGPEGQLEELFLEAYGPGGVAIIIEGITDNKNRMLGEIRQILNQHNGKLANEGSVMWMFNRQEKEGGHLEWIPKYEVEVTEQERNACQRLFDALDENEAVQEIYSNLKV